MIRRGAALSARFLYGHEFHSGSTDDLRQLYRAFI